MITVTLTCVTLPGTVLMDVKLSIMVHIAISVVQRIVITATRKMVNALCHAGRDSMVNTAQKSVVNPVSTKYAMTKLFVHLDVRTVSMEVNVRRFAAQTVWTRFAI